MNFAYAQPAENAPSPTPAEVAATATPPAVIESSAPRTGQQNFDSGLNAFQRGDLKAARTSFEEAIRRDGETPVLLYNLGLVEQRQGKLGRALALWRKALVNEASFSPARRAVKWTKAKLERQEIAHEVEFWESFRSNVLSYVTVDQLLIAVAVFFFAGGWLFIRYFGLRRNAKLEEKPYPGFPYLASALTLIFVATLLLAAAKAYDLTEIRGTILMKQVEAKSSPDTAATTLFDLYEGLEVIVRQTAGEWSQVTYPGGSTGWIPRSALLATNDLAVSTGDAAKAEK